METPTLTRSQYNKKLLRIARRFYPHVLSLIEYIRLLNEHLSIGIAVQQSSDTESYARLLSSLLVAFPSPPSFPKNAMEGLPLKSVSMDDVLTQVISSTLRKHQNTSKRADQVNVLCNGFFLSKQDGLGSVFRDLDVRAPSTSARQLRSPNFGILFSRVGFVVFRHILMEASLLLGVQERVLDSIPKSETVVARLPSCVLLQLCGPAAIPDQAVKSNSTCKERHGQSFLIDSDIIIKRDLMYRTPPSNPRFMKLCRSRSVINRGLPAAHHFHRFPPSLRNAEHLIRIIFPMCDPTAKQNKMQKSESHGRTQLRANVRRYDIVATSLLKSIIAKDVALAPIPPRLKRLAPTLRELTRRVQKHCFRRLLGLHCPLPNDFRANDSSNIRLLNMYSNPVHVAKYLRACVQKVFPNEAFGSPKNRGVIYKGINHFVLRRNEKEHFDIRAFISREGFKVCDVPWLHRKGPNGHRTINPTDLHFRTARIIEFVTWVFKGFIIPLISQSFYVTEAEKHRYQLFYYRREVWTILQDRAEKQHYEDSHQFEELSADDFNACARQQIDVNSILSSSKPAVLLFHDIRYVPKKSSLRGIQRLRLKVFPTDSPNVKTDLVKRLYKQKRTTMDATMRDFVKILRREAEGNELSIGAAVFGLDDIYRKLVQAKHEWKQNGYPTLYACALDIKASFDTIPLRKLFEDVVPHLFPKDRYVLLRYKLSKRQITTCRVFHRYLTHVCTKPGEETSFYSVVRTALAGAHAGGLFSDLVRMDTWRKDVICKLLSEALCNNIVILSRRRHRASGFAIQRHGLPQGHPLSHLLTSLFYGFIERHDLGEYLEGSERARELDALKGDIDTKLGGVAKKEVVLLMRLVDDTFFFSSSRAQADHFIRRMLEQSRSTFYGFSVNMDKAKTNFSTPLVPNRIQRFIPWCGILIDTETLEVRGDFARYKTEIGDRLRNTIMIEYDKKPCRRMADKAYSCFNPKIHPLLFDRQINSQSTVVLNIYQSALLSCLKLCSYVIEIKPTNVHFFVSMVDSSVLQFACLVSRCTTSFKARAHNCRLPCSILELRYICTHSYYNGIARKLCKQRGMNILAEASMKSLQNSLRSIVDVLSARNKSNVTHLCRRIAARECNSLWDLRL